MGAYSATLLLAGLMIAGVGVAQETATTASKPTEHVIGTVTAVDTAAHTISVKEDKTGTEDTVELAATKTLIKVPPGAKDLKSATRITADDLAVGDRVDVRGSKPPDNPNGIAARSVVLMSARDLQAARQEQAAAWKRATAGVVDSVDAATGKLTITVRTPEGPKPMTVDTSKNTQFTRYSPETPGTPEASNIAEVQPHDQVRVIGEKSPDGASITADRLYSGAFRTVSGTIISIAPDGKALTIKDLATKQPMEIALSDNSAIRKLPPMLAMGLARRFNPTLRGANSPSASNGSGAPPGGGSPTGQGAWQGGSGPTGNGSRAGSAPGERPGGPGTGMRSGGDVSQMIERLPKVSLADLKPGDAVVIAGVSTGGTNSRLLATNVIAGVEPILQAAPARQGGQSLGGDWGLSEMAAPQ